MHSNSQDSRCEGGDAEVFSSLRLSGFDGRCKAVLDSSRLILERRSGHTLNLMHDAVARMRHHTTPLIPRWLFGIGLFLIYAAWRVFLPPAQYWFLGVGSAIILGWALGRRPTLTIDTTNGDCHTLYGNDASLMRMTALVQRLQDGQTLEEAREGLAFLMRTTDFPTTKAIEERLVAESEPEPLLASTSITTLLGDDSDEQKDLPPVWLGSIAGSAVVSNEPEHTEQRYEPHSFKRARDAHSEISHNPMPYDQVKDPWAMNDVKPMPNSAFQQEFTSPQNEQFQAPMNEGFSMFGEGGIFDAPSSHPTSPPQPIVSTPSYQQNIHDHRLPWQENRHRSSMEMLKDAGGISGDAMLKDDVQVGLSQAPTKFIPSFLPPVDLNDPEKDRIQVEPDILDAEMVDGDSSQLVASAKMANAERSEGLERFPHMQKLRNDRSGGRLRRIRFRNDSIRLGSTKTVRNRLLPGLGKLGQKARGLLKRGGSEFRTAELLRLEAKRNSDSQLIIEIQRMADSEKGLVVDEVSRMLENHRAGILPDVDVPLRFSDLSATSDSSTGVAGLPRLDSND